MFTRTIVVGACALVTISCGQCGVRLASEYELTQSPLHQSVVHITECVEKWGASAGVDHSYTGGVHVASGNSSSVYERYWTDNLLITNSAELSSVYLLVRTLRSSDMAGTEIETERTLYLDMYPKIRTFESERSSDVEYWIYEPVSLHADVEGGYAFMGWQSVYFIRKGRTVIRIEVRHTKQKAQRIMAATEKFLEDGPLPGSMWARPAKRSDSADTGTDLNGAKLR